MITIIYHLTKDMKKAVKYGLIADVLLVIAIVNGLK